MIRKIYRKIFKTASLIKTYLSVLFTKNVFVFGAPYHSNMGDQAQSYCIQKYAEENYPGHKVRIYTTGELSDAGYQPLRVLRKAAKKSDIVFLHSGYHTTDLYPLEEHMQREVIRLFSDRKITILPQTVFFSSAEEQAQSSELYNGHGQVTLLCRDEKSLETAKTIFSNCKLILFPDIVTTEIGKHYYDYQRKGILLCVRHDKESILSETDLLKMKEDLSAFDAVEETDTTIRCSLSEIQANRKKILEEIWDSYAHYKLIITDRYHGTIFSLIANTPVIVIPSVDHKLESGVKWFPEEFRDYVCYVPHTEQLPDVVRGIYSKTYSYRLPPYFQSNYYDKLQQLL